MRYYALLLHHFFYTFAKIESNSSNSEYVVVIGGATSSALSSFPACPETAWYKRRPFLAATEISSDAFENGCNLPD